ncbi:MAG TPA: ATP-binding protein [Solirubrobacteraceae bacterium]|nr:ATP-binding protein [Solirubrobacteraceae bacterium]
MTLPGAAESVGEIRTAVSQLATDCGFSEQKVEAIRLAVSEAASNAVIHGYSENPGQITVSAELDDDRVLEVVIADQGRGMLPHRDSDGLGLGVPLMTTLSDHVEIISATDMTGTEVHLYFRIAD